MAEDGVVSGGTFWY